EDVKPLFRERDREAMRFAFDLWSAEDVSTHADSILGRLAAGTMPCDGAWPAEQVEVFRQWIDAGKPAEVVADPAAPASGGGSGSVGVAWRRRSSTSIHDDRRGRMRVFLAGATGVIGTPLVQQLLQAGHQVTAMTRSVLRAAQLEAAGADPVVCDVFDADGMR